MNSITNAFLFSEHFDSFYENGSISNVAYDVGPNVDHVI